MAAPTPSEVRAIRRAVGGAAYDLWYASLEDGDEELQEVFETASSSVLLTAAQICRYLADPTREVFIKLDGKGSRDTRGQSDGWHLKAQQLEGQASAGFGIPGPFFAEVVVACRAEGESE